MRTLTLIIFLLMISATGYSQSQYQAVFQGNFVIAGTSTLHDWTMETERAEGRAILQVEAGKLVAINQLKISVPAESLKSGKEAMDKKAYNALKTDQYPTIEFDLAGLELLKQEEESIYIESIGNLTIAGTTRQEHIIVIYHIDQQGIISFRGSKELNMSSYGVKPPSFMLGTVKTGDKITVSFDIQFNLEEKNLTLINSY